MPMNDGKSDRKLLIGVGVVLLLILVASALLSPGGDTGSIPSSYLASPEGAKGAYLTLKDAGYHVEQWENPPQDLPANGHGIVLILAEPVVPPEQGEAAEVQRFLASGGTVLLTGLGDGLVPGINFRSDVVTGKATVSPAAVSRLTAGGDITMQSWLRWDKDDYNVVTHFADDEGPVVVSYPVGQGRVIWWAGSTPLANLSITDAGNLDLLLAAVGDAHQVLWDEYFHGQRRSLLGYAEDPPVAWTLVQAGLVLLVLVLTYSRRHGPVVPIATTGPRLSPLEFVRTLGGLYENANAAQVAVEIAYQRFRHRMARSFGLSPELPAAQLAEALEAVVGRQASRLSATLAECESAVSQPELDSATAVRLTQALNELSMQLGSAIRSQEKTQHGSGATPFVARTN